MVRDIWFEQSIGDGWMAAFRLAPQNGQLVVSELRVFPEEPKRKRPGTWSAETRGYEADAPPGGLGARKLRHVTFEQALSQTREILAQWTERYGEDLYEPAGVFSRFGIGRLAAGARRKPGPKGHGDAFYAGIARLYVEKREGGSRKPVADVAAELRRPQSHIRELLRTARERGLLTQTQRGRAGGQLTDRARSVLEEEEKKP